MAQTADAQEWATGQQPTGHRLRDTMLRGATRVPLYVVVILLSFLFAAPLLWMVSTSLKTDPQVYRIPPVWIPSPARFLNYPEA